jgi:hypothetical protein
MPDAELLANSPFADDLDASLAARPTGRSRPTLYLAAGIILIAGFLGGVQAQKWSSSGTASPTGGAEGGGAPEARTPGRDNGPPGGGMTAGTITKIVGNTLYLRTSSGQTVKVRTGGTTKVRITKDGELRDLDTGATVTVRGTKGEDGAITAATVDQGTAR